VSATTKLELLGLIDRAVADGWAHTRACGVLEVADVRAHRWRAPLRETGSLDDRPPGLARTGSPGSTTLFFSATGSNVEGDTNT
jgi:hypothetical protein